VRKIKNVLIKPWGIRLPLRSTSESERRPDETKPKACSADREAVVHRRFWREKASN
jgi:hypothetical protein